ncbi:MAG TPA: zinc-binding dehydrogenase [Vicinamibacterales bacterium]|nr:zinc-binding dehydrogenase [Vicinamibacterales bacterium]HOQ59146.1 zinc-binding dehydrogenase [Vicinamibacterales bacterium]HPK70930.1 zinc-binding dehydrogenase [Vicinamibacterales bacterium]
MQAIVLRELGGPERLVLETAADPAPGPGEAVVRLRAAALNRRDAWIRQGQYAGIRLPIILGSDGAGEVTAVGEGVDRAWPGTAVVINPSLEWGPDSRAQGPSFRILGLPDHGTYAELVKVPAANLYRKPASLSWEAAAAIPLAGLTAYRALVTRARLQPGETVLVTGVGGGVATFVLLFALHLGARVVVTSGSDAKIARARELGAAGGANYRLDGWGQAIARLTDGGPDVIVDSAGREAFPTLLEVVRPGGRIVTFGATTGSASTVEVRRVFWKQVDILGSTMGTPEEFSSMLALFDRGLEPVIDRTFPLAAAADAHRRMDQADQFGKLVLTIQPQA